MNKKIEEILIDEYGIHFDALPAFNKTQYFIVDVQDNTATEINNPEIEALLVELWDSKDELTTLKGFEDVLNKLNIKAQKPFKRLLRNKGISGRQLSIKTGIPQQTISSWSSGYNDVKKASFEHIIEIIKILDMTAEELWDEINR